MQWKHCKDNDGDGDNDENEDYDGHNESHCQDDDDDGDNDDNEDDDEGNESHCKSHHADDDLEDGGEVPVDDGRPHGGVLAESELEEESGDPDDEQHQEVRDQEGAASILEGRRWSLFIANCILIYKALSQAEFMTAQFLQKL